MVSQLTVEDVERREDHYRVNFRDEDSFDELESPDWAQELAESEVPGTDVRMGQDETGDWLVRSILIPSDVADSDEDASRKALEVVTVISDREEPT